MSVVEAPPARGTEPPEPANTAARRARLASMRRRAAGLLVAVTALYVVLQLAAGDATWVGYVEATLEAAMVGGSPTGSR